MAVTQAEAKKALTRHGKANTNKHVFLADVDGDVWFTNSYYASKVGDRGPVAGWFRSFNLEPTSGMFDVNGTVTRQSDEYPELSTIVGGVVEASSELESVQIEGRPAFVKGVKGGWLRVFTSQAGEDRPVFTVAADEDYLSWCERSSGVVAWRGKDGLKPLAGLNAAGELVAIVMPVRLSS